MRRAAQRAQRSGQRCHHGAEDAGIHHAGGHGTALVNAQDDVALRLLRLAAEADQGLRHDRLIVLLIVPQVGADGAVPVNLGQTWATVAHGTVECAGDGCAHGLGELAHEFVHDFAHHHARGFLRLGRDDAGEGDEAGDEMHIRLHGLQHFRLEQHLAHA